MKRRVRKKNDKINNIKYPYLLTSYNKNYNTPFNSRSNKSYQNKTHNKLNINVNNTFNLFNPDEEYVTKLNFFSIGSKRDNAKKITLYNLNTVPLFPSILKKDSDNAESFNEKKRILNELNAKKTMFDMHKNSEGSKQTYVNRYENTFKENQLEKERKEIEKKIYKLKEMIKSLSSELSVTINEIDNLKLDVEIMQNYRSYNLFNNVNNKRSDNRNKDNQSKNNNDLSNKKIRKSLSKEKESTADSEKLKEREKENKFKLEMMLISKGEKVNKIKQEMKTKIKELEEKQISLIDKIDVCENELKKFKEIHHNIKEELLVHYHRLLSEGKDTRKEGLSWIILAIWNLKSNVLLSYLPKFLDQNIILFLFEYSSLLKKIKETEKKIQELALKLKEHKENIKNMSNKNDDNLNNYINKNEEENDINNKDELDINKNNIDEEEENEKEDNEEDENEDNDGLNNDTSINNEKNENNLNKNNDNKIKDNNLNINEEIKEQQNETDKEEIENEEQNIMNDINNIQNIQKEDKYMDNNPQTKFGETFKTSLYNTNSEKIDTKNNNIFFDKDNFKKENNNAKEDNFLNKKEKKRKKEEININNLPINFVKSLFRKEDLYKGHKSIEDKEKKVKLNDFKNIFNRKQSYMNVVDYKTFELFNEHKNMEKYCLKLKEKADLLMKKELERISKSFYLYDYGGKYNIDQKTVISALVGEDSVRNEYNKQKKQEKEYFRTLRELRNGKIIQKK